MNKALFVIALGLGLGAGLLWPLGQESPDPPIVETAPAPVEPTAPAANQPPADDQPAAQPAPTRPEPVPNKPEPDPAPPEAKPQPDPVAKPPTQARAKPPAKPKTRVIQGQTPEEVLANFRRSPPPARTISPPAPARTIDQPLAAPRPKPKPRPRPKTRPAERQTPKAEPIDGNYCYLVYGYDDWPTDVAFAVCMGESNGRPGAVNRRDRHEGCSGSYGLFQIACFWANPNDMLDPHQNIKKARWLYRRSGWQPWGAYTNGSYRRYLPSP